MESPYSPLSRELEHIRLLVVQAGPKHEDAYCNLRIVSLLDRPMYETISYVWGDAKVRGSIHLNGEPMDVPASSEGAIRRVKLPDKDRIIWIDAVCIDQKNVAERGHQVGIMDKIYEKGRLNLICLDFIGDRGEDVVETVESILQDARRETNDLKDFGKTVFGYDQIAFVPSNTPLSVTVDLQPLLDFLASAWFGRKWVLQEAALAPSSICLYREHSIPLINVLQACAWLSHKYIATGIPWDDNLDRGSKMFNFVEKNHGLYSPEFGVPPYLVEFLFTGELATTDPRDQVFGVIGLYKQFARLRKSLQQLPSELASPDYNISTADLFTAATRFTVKERGDLGVLRFVEKFSGAEGDAGYPSWVPRWHRPNSWLYILIEEEGSDSADGGAEMCQAMQENDWKILIATGWVATTISNVTSIPTSVDDLRRDELRIYSSARALIDSGDHELQNTLKSMLAITLSTGADFNNRNWSAAEANISHHRLDEYVQRKGKLPDRSRFYAHLTPDDPVRLAAEYNDQVVACHRYRRLFLATTSSLGLGPSATCVGDIVVVLYGSRLPVVLRPRLDLPNGDHYQFIGLCYFHEVMDGTATRKYQANGGEAMTFKLV